MGSAFTTVGVGCGVGVSATGVAVAQAVNRNNTNKQLNRELGNFFIGSNWTPSNINTQDGSTGLMKRGVLGQKQRDQLVKWTGLLSQKLISLAFEPGALLEFPEL